MKITYDTVSDSISCPDLSPEQTRALQAELSAALMRNDPVQAVAARIMAAVKAAQAGLTCTTCMNESSASPRSDESRRERVLRVWAVARDENGRSRKEHFGDSVSRLRDHCRLRDPYRVRDRMSRR